MKKGEENIDEKLTELEMFARHAWMIKQDDLAFETIEEECSNEILRNKLWIGDFETQRAPPANIGAIVSLGRRYAGYVTHEHIKYHRIMIDDTPISNLLQHMNGACKFIKAQIKAGKQVLVHCQAGVSRSASICIAYLIKEHYLTFIQAYVVVKAARPLISPNHGYVSQLLKWQIAQEEEKKLKVISLKMEEKV